MLIDYSLQGSEKSFYKTLWSLSTRSRAGVTALCTKKIQLDLLHRSPAALCLIKIKHHTHQALQMFQVVARHGMHRWFRSA
jgi:hypothetical protein